MHQILSSSSQRIWGRGLSWEGPDQVLLSYNPLSPILIQERADQPCWCSEKQCHSQRQAVETGGSPMSGHKAPAEEMNPPISFLPYEMLVLKPPRPQVLGRSRSPASWDSGQSQLWPLARVAPGQPGPWSLKSWWASQCKGKANPASEQESPNHAALPTLPFPPHPPLPSPNWLAFDLNTESSSPL